jgi:hypothetical protein
LKKALVLTIAAVVGLGLAASATMGGTWGAEISIDPGTTLAGNLFVDLTSTVDVDYTIGDWVFGAAAGFDRLGWSTMSFDAVGVLGAFSFTAELNFMPRTITGYTLVIPLAPQTYSMINPLFLGPWADCWDADEICVPTYGAAFDDLTFTASVSIAGVTIEGLFYLDGYAGDAVCPPWAYYYLFADGTLTPWVSGMAPYTTYALASSASTATTGSGFRFSLSGTAGSLEITSLTYFSLTEPFATVTCGWALAKKGSGFTVDGCELGFTEQYFHIDGFTFGCATFEVGLDITCAGFSWVAFAAHDIDLGVWGLVGDFYVKFSTMQKYVDFCLDFDLDVVCFDIGVSLDYEDYVVGGFSIDSLTLETELNGVTFTSTTQFDGCLSEVTDESMEIGFLVPVEGLTYTDPNTYEYATFSLIGASTTDGLLTGLVDGFFTPVCEYEEKWCVFETIEIAVDGDSCCGGAFDFSIETGFGTKEEIKAFAWYYQFEDDTDFDNVANVDFNVGYLYDGFLAVGDTVPTIVAVVGGTDANNDGVPDDLNVVETVVLAGTETYAAGDQNAAEELLYGALYEAAASDSLFSWVYTNVELSIGIGSAWSLIFGAGIDVYGWNALSFGFEFTF